MQVPSTVIEGDTALTCRSGCGSTGTAGWAGSINQLLADTLGYLERQSQGAELAVVT